MNLGTINKHELLCRGKNCKILKQNKQSESENEDEMHIIVYLLDIITHAKDKKSI